MPAAKYRFDDFELDVPKRRLTRDGELIPLNPKAFDMLSVLVEHNGKLLSKDDLLRLVWDGQFVEEANLTVNMSAIRKALGETAKTPRYITTVSGRGYYFTGRVVKAEPQFVVENRTMSRVTMAEEDEFEEPPERPQLYGVPRRNKMVVILPLLLLAIAGTLWYFLADLASEAPFSKIRVHRLTTTGRITGGAISPDGKLFAYAQQENDGKVGILLEHVDGTNRVQLREPGSYSVVGMTFTPDSRHIYYSISGSESELSGLYRMPAFGGAAEFLKEGVSRITFAPDGQRYAFIRSDSTLRTSAIKYADVSTGSETVLYERSSAIPFVGSTIDWSKDGQQIAISALTDSGSREQEVFLLGVEDRTLLQLTSAKWNGVRALAWLSNSKGIVATAGDLDVGWEAQLWHISSTSGNATRLLSDLNTYGLVLSTADHGRALLTVQAQFYSNIWVAPADDIAAAKQVTFDMLGRQNGWDGLAWSPDGKILFTSYVDRSETIWSLDLTDNSSKQLIPNGRRNMLVSMSADGSLMVFESNRSGASEIWAAAGDGSYMRQLTTGGSNFQPHIAPDGSRAIYQALRDGTTSLWQVPLSGGEPDQIIDRSISWAQFSPDGRYLAAAISDSGRTRLGIFYSAGGDPIKVFDFPRRANYRLGIQWTPDGSAVTYRDWVNGIWRQPLDGGEPVRIEGLPEEKVYAYGWSKDGKRFAYSRGMEIRDIVLITEEK